MDLFSFLHTTKKAIPYLTDIKNQNYKLKHKNKYCKIVLKTPKNDLKFKYGPFVLNQGADVTRSTQKSSQNLKYAAKYGAASSPTAALYQSFKTSLTSI